MIRTLVKMEATYVNKSNPDFNERRIEIMYKAAPDQQQKRTGAYQKPASLKSLVASDARGGRFAAVGNPRGIVMTDLDMENAEKMRSLVVAYVEVIKDKIKDVIPKTIMCFLINDTINSVGNTLVETLYKGDFEQLMAEDDELVAKRRKLREMLTAFEKASEALSELNDMRL